MMMLAEFIGVEWENLGVGVAAILGLIYVARTMARVLRDQTSGISARQTEMLTWFGNHLSNISSSLEGTALSIQKVVDRLDVLHEDATKAADTLLAADSLVRMEMDERQEEHARIADEVRYLRIATFGVRGEGDAEQRHEGERGE